MGRLGAGIGLGMISGPAIGGLLARFGEWAPPAGAAALAFIDLIGVFFFMPETRRRGARAEQSAPRVTLVSVLGERRLAIVLSIYFCTFLYMTNIQSVFALLANLRFGWGEGKVATVFVAWGVVMLIVQGVLIGRIAKRFRALSVIVAGAIVSGTGLTLVAVSATPFVMIVGLAGLGIGLGITQPMLATIASEYAGSSQRGAVLGFAQSAGGLARTIGPTMSGFLYVAISPGAPFLAGAGAAMIALVLATVLRRETMAPAT
jgi:predicted MFS family arabinose efflux permease